MALATAKLDKLQHGRNAILLILGHFLLVALGTSLVVALPRTAHAQEILIKRFTDLTGKAKFGQKAQMELVNALTRKGATLKDTKQYLNLAKKKKIPANEAFLGPNIKRLAKALNITGVVLGKAAVEKRKFKLALNVFNKRGNLVLKKIFVTQNPELTPEAADNILVQIYTRLGIVERPQPAPEQPAVTQPPEIEAPATGPTESTLPSWARKETTPAVAPPPAPPVAPPPSPAQEAEATAKPTEQREKGSVSDVLLTAGIGVSLRNAHLAISSTEGFINSNAFPSFKIDGRFMLGALTDVPFLKDLGIGSSFNMSLGLKYSPTDGTAGAPWDAHQYQWHVEAIYRLAFNSVLLQPAFLLRVGYGMTISSIENSYMNVLYKYPFAAIDVYLMLWKPYLRFFVSPGIMFAVQSEKNVPSSGNGSLGFSLSTGFELQLFKYLAIGVGYDLSQFLIKLQGGGSTSDVYQTFFLRAGVTF